MILKHARNGVEKNDGQKVQISFKCITSIDSAWSELFFLRVIDGEVPQADASRDVRQI